MTDLPLARFTIVEVNDRDVPLCLRLATSLAGKIAADLGATVLKVEPSDGDPVRRAPPFLPQGDSALFQFLALLMEDAQHRNEIAVAPGIALGAHFGIGLIGIDRRAGGRRARFRQPFDRVDPVAQHRHFAREGQRDCKRLVDGGIGEILRPFAACLLLQGNWVGHLRFSLS